MPNGNIIVGDYWRASVFDSDFKFVRLLETSADVHRIYAAAFYDAKSTALYLGTMNKPEVIVYDSNLNKRRCFGSTGTGDGQSNGILAVSSDSSGLVYIADCYNERIQALRADGSFMRSWKQIDGASPATFRPAGLMVSSKDEVWICDCINSRVLVCDQYGKLLKQRITGISPHHVAFDRAGNALVCVRGAIEVFNSNLELVTEIRHPELSQQWSNVDSLCVHNDGRILVGLAQGERVLVFAFTE